ncbi:hypothetical protein BASA81_003949 [Batrachochytrium salamandrivorans]|nr:hypothetical protein BASA81_003949 [Batrachochytrium salamandrivorans]
MGAAFSLCSMASTAFVSSFGLLFQGLSCAFTAAAAFSCLFNKRNAYFESVANMFVPGYFPNNVRWECNKGVEAVHRISFSLAMFFATMLIVSFAVPKIHRGFWMIKIVAFVGLLIGSAFMDGFDSGTYSQVARFGGMAFLVLQIFLLIDFVYRVNERLVDEEQITAILVGSLGLVVLSLAGLVCLLVFYSNCVEGIVFTVLTLVFSIAVLLLSVLRYRFIDDCEGTLLPTCAVVFYSVYLAWSSLESNHHECRVGAGGENQTTLSIVLGSILSTASLMWATFSVSNGMHRPDTLSAPPKQQQQREDLVESGRPTSAHYLMRDGDRESGEEEEQEEVTESLWSFYLIMLFASMYMSMLLTDWGTKTVQAPKADDNAAFASMYVKIAAQWVTLLMFTWTLVAPAVLKDREF